MASSSQVNNNLSPSATTVTQIPTLSIDSTKLPDSWKISKKSTDSITINSVHFGSEVTVSIKHDTTAKISSQTNFIETHREKASNATTTNYGTVLLPSRELSISTTTGLNTVTAYPSEVRDYLGTLYSTHIEGFIVKNGSFIHISVIHNSGVDSSSAEVA